METGRSSSELAQKLDKLAREFFTAERLKDQSIIVKQQDSAEVREETNKPRHVVIPPGLDRFEARCHTFEQVGTPLCKRLREGHDVSCLLLCQGQPTGDLIWGEPSIGKVTVSSISPQLVSASHHHQSMDDIEEVKADSDPTCEVNAFPTSHGLVPRIIEELFQTKGLTLHVLHEEGYWQHVENVEQAFLVMNECKALRQERREHCWMHGLRVSFNGNGNHVQHQKGGTRNKVYAFFFETNLPQSIEELNQVYRYAKLMHDSAVGSANVKNSAESHRMSSEWKLYVEQKLAECFLCLGGSTVLVPNDMVSVGIRMVRYATSMFPSGRIPTILPNIPAFLEAPYSERIVRFNECLLKILVRRPGRKAELVRSNSNNDIEVETEQQEQTEYLDVDPVRLNVARTLASSVVDTVVSTGFVQACTNLRTQALQNLFKRMLVKQQEQQSELERDLGRFRQRCDSLEAEKAKANEELANVRADLQEQERKHLELVQVLAEKDALNAAMEVTEADPSDLGLALGHMHPILETTQEEGTDSRRHLEEPAHFQKELASKSNEMVATLSCGESKFTSASIRQVLQQETSLHKLIQKMLKSHDKNPHPNAKQVRHRAFLEQVTALCGAMSEIITLQSEESLREETECLRAQVSQLRKVVQVQKRKMLEHSKHTAVLKSQIAAERASLASNELQTKLFELQDMYEAKLNELETLRMQVDVGHAEDHVTLSSSSPSSQISQDASNTQQQQQQQELEKAREKLRDLEEQQDSLLEICEENDDMIQNLRMENAKLVSTSEDLNTTLASLQKQCDTLKEQLGQRDTALRMALSEKAELEEEANSLRMELLTVNTRLPNGDTIEADCQTVEEFVKNQHEREDAVLKQEDFMEGEEQQQGVQSQQQDGMEKELHQDDALQEDDMEATSRTPAGVVADKSSPLSSFLEQAATIPKGVRSLLESLAIDQRNWSAQLRKLEQEVDKSKTALEKEREAGQKVSEELHSAQAQIGHMNAHREAQSHVVSDLKSQMQRQHTILGELRVELEMNKRKRSELEERLQASEETEQLILHMNSTSGGGDQAKTELTNLGSKGLQLSPLAIPGGAFNILSPQEIGSPVSPRRRRSSFSEALARFAFDDSCADANSQNLDFESSRSLLRAASKEFSMLRAEMQELRMRCHARVVFEEASRELAKLAAKKEVAIAQDERDQLQEQVEALVNKPLIHCEVQTDTPLDPQASKEEILEICNELTKLKTKIRETALGQDKILEGELADMQSKLDEAFEKIQMLHLLKEKWKSKFSHIKQREEHWSNLLRAQVDKITEQLNTTQAELSLTKARLEEAQLHLKDCPASPKNHEPRSVPELMAFFQVSPHITAAKRTRVARILEDLKFTFSALSPYLDAPRLQNRTLHGFELIESSE